MIICALQELGKVEQSLKADRYMFPHYKYYVREVKIKAYAQLLESYRSLTLAYMADAFGVTEDYIDSELCRFIAGGRLHAKIDKVCADIEKIIRDSYLFFSSI